MMSRLRRGYYAHRCCLHLSTPLILYPCMLFAVKKKTKRAKQCCFGPRKKELKLPHVAFCVLLDFLYIFRYYFMPKPVNSRLLALGGGTFLTCAVGYFGFYLPFYSSAALENKKRRGRIVAEKSTETRSNSVWANIDAATKRAKDQKKDQKSQ